MRLRVNISNEEGAESSVVNTDDVKDKNLKDALEFTAKASGKIGHSGTFGPYEVIHGSILQAGYAMNEEIKKISEKEDLITISVDTDI